MYQEFLSKTQEMKKTKKITSYRHGFKKWHCKIFSKEETWLYLRTTLMSKARYNLSLSLLLSLPKLKFSIFQHTSVMNTVT